MHHAAARSGGAVGIMGRIGHQAYGQRRCTGGGSRWWWGRSCAAILGTAPRHAADRGCKLARCDPAHANGRAMRQYPCPICAARFRFSRPRCISLVLARWRCPHLLLGCAQTQRCPGLLLAVGARPHAQLMQAPPEPHGPTGLLAARHPARPARRACNWPSAPAPLRWPSCTCPTTPATAAMPTSSAPPPCGTWWQRRPYALTTAHLVLSGDGLHWLPGLLCTEADAQAEADRAGGPGAGGGCVRRARLLHAGLHELGRAATRC